MQGIDDTEGSLDDTRYRSILEMANDGIIVVQDDKIVMCNNAFGEMLQYDSSDLLNLSIELILDPIAAHLYHENQERFKWGQTSRPSFRVRFLTSNKQPVTVEVSTADFIFNGRPAIVAIARNITERMALEAAIEESETRYRNLYDSSPIAYLTLSPRGTIQQVNKIACKLFGYEEANLLKRNILTFIPKSNEVDVGSQILSEINQGKSINDFEMQITNSEGELVWVSLTASPLTPGSNGTHNMGFMLVDIDRRKKAEFRAKMERERANLYLECMTHDLNNVNQSLMFSLGLLRETMKLPEHIIKMLRDTNWSIRRSSRMIKTMRSIINIRDAPPERVKVDIAVPLERGLELAQQDFAWKELVIDSDVPMECFFVAGHEYLEDVFFHILHNALTYDESNKVKVKIRADKQTSTNTVRISISDWGPGVPDRIKELIFRRTGSPHQQIVGRGLGLTLVDSIIRDLEGEVYVVDRVKGNYTKGTTFVIELPIWVEILGLECGRSTCISFYKSNHCLFCEPTFEILMSVIEELGLPSYLVEVINVDSPGTEISEGDLPMLPFIRICDAEHTGFVDADQIRSSLMNLMMKHCFPELG